MSDENLDIGTEEVPADVEYTEAEQSAMAKGWSPDKDAVEASGKNWIPAEEFLAREPLYKEISNLKKANKTQTKQFEALNEHLNRLRDSMASERISGLQKEKRAAVEEGNVTEVDRIDTEIEKVKKETAAPQKAAESTNQAFDEFKSDNSWYGSNRKMTAYADYIGKELAQSNKYESYEDFYADVAAEVKKEYPEEFGSKKPSASPVEGASTRSATSNRGVKKKYSLKDVPEEFREVAKRLTSGPHAVMTEEKYIEDLIKAGYL